MQKDVQTSDTPLQHKRQGTTNNNNKKYQLIFIPLQTRELLLPCEFNLLLNTHSFYSSETLQASAADIACSQKKKKEFKW